jgi:hypothetical protein
LAKERFRFTWYIVPWLRYNIAEQLVKSAVARIAAERVQIKVRQ